MSRRRDTGVAAAGALGLLAIAGGCRGVLGIEPLELVDGGQVDGSLSDGSSEGGAQAESGADGGSEAQAESGPADAGIDVFAACANEGGMACNPCCKTNFQAQTGALIQTMIQTGCICGTSGSCISQCDASICAGSSNPPPMACAQCMDTAVLGPGSLTPACNQAVTECNSDQACSPIITCLQGCH